MKYEIAEVTAIGPRRVNEDAIGVVHITDQLIGVAVADGLGGMGGGDKASSIAVDMFKNSVSRHFANEDSLRDLVRSIHARLLEEQLSLSENQNMATTLTAAIIDRDQLIGVHCGDTRLVIARAKGIKRLTTDHSEGMRLLNSGKISKQEYADYPRKHILDSALGGHKYPQIDTFTFQLERLDKIVISSDGMHQKVLLRELRDIITMHKKPLDFAQELKSLVDQRGPNDNYSFVAVFCS